MEYKCIHMKFGTVIYRKEGDLLTSLSWALGTLSSYTEGCQLGETMCIADNEHKNAQRTGGMSMKL